MKHLIAVLIITILASCSKELPFPSSNISSVLVANSLYTVDSDFTIDLSNTVSNSQFSIPKKIENANVSITDLLTNTTTQLPHTQDGLYSRPGFGPTEGVNYQLTVSAEGYSDIRSSVEKNAVPKDFSFELTNHRMGKYKGTETFFATIDIVDNAEEENYYLIKIKDFINPGGSIIGSNNVFGHFTADTNEDEISNVNELDGDLGGQSKLFFSDKNFNGKAYTIDVWWSDILLQSIGQTTDNYLECHITSVSKALFEYEKSLEGHRHSLYQEL